MGQDNVGVLHIASDDAPYVQVLQVKAFGIRWPVSYVEAEEGDDSFYCIVLCGHSFIGDTIEELQQVINDAGLNK